MASRTVSVRLQAEIGQYVSGMSKASAATMRLGDTASSSTAKARGGFDIAGKGALLMGGAVVAGMGLAISKSMEFEAAMSGAAAATQVTGAALEDLREAAMKAGADTQYSATEAAQAITEMGKAGVSTADILGGGLDGALALAAAGQLEVGKAAEIASVAMTQFGLSGEQLPHVADLLAAGAGKAMGSVEDLGMALNQAGLIASQSGLSIEETTGTLAAFASAGLVGSDAGTSLKTALQKLQNPSKEAAETMAELGISMYDSQGQFIGMEALAGQLQTSMKGLTPAVRDAAMAQIFGSDAVRAANVLYKEGAGGIAEWTNKVNDQGYAAEQAAALNDNLKGDLERLGGAFDTLMIQMGSGAQGPLREIVQMFTGMLDVAADLLGFWSDLPGPVQLAVGALGGIALLKGPVGGALETIGLKAMYARDAIMAPGGLKAAGSGLLGVFGGPWGLALAGAVTGLSLLTSWLGKSSESTQQAADYQDRLTTALEESNGALDENIRAIAAREAAETEIGDGNLLSVSRELGVELPRVTDALLGNRDAYTEIEGAADAYLQRALELSGFNTEDAGFVAASEKVAGYKGALEDLFPNLAGIKQGQQDVAVATSETGVVVDESTVQTEEATKALEDWLKALQGIAAGFVEPLGAYKALMDEKIAKDREQAEATAASTEDASDSWEDYVTNVDVSLTELADRLDEQITNQMEWRTNIGLIAQWAGADVANHLAQMGTEGVDLVAKMADGSSAEAQRMAGLIREDIRLGGIGWSGEMDTATKVMAEVGRQGAGATVKSVSDALGIGLFQVKDILGQYGVAIGDGINPVLIALGRDPVHVAKRVAGGATVNSLGRGGLAEGGMVPGPYIGPKADNVLIRANPREFMQPVAAVDHYGVDFMEAIRQRRIPKDAIAGYADGGLIGFGRRLQSMGARVTGHSAFGGREYGQHGRTSKHYTDDAIDVNTRAGTSALEQRELAPMMALARSLGFRTIFMAPGHFNHGHVDTGRGGSIGSTSDGDPVMPAINIPAPPATPFRPPISTAAGGAMNFAYEAAKSWAASNALYDTGGILQHGAMGINLSGSPERVLNPRETAAYDAGLRAREFSGASAGGRGGSVSVAAPIVKVYLDGQEWRGMARVEAEGVVIDAFTGTTQRGQYNS